MKKKILLLCVALILFSTIASFSILIYKKYDQVEIISLKREYNCVLSDTETLSIPLYFSKNNSFLTNKKQIESISIINNDNGFISYLEDLKEGDKLTYKNQKYYEFIFILSFKSYEDFSDPVYIKDAKIKITYKNGVIENFLIGNANILFNSNISDNNDFSVLKLSAVTNTIDEMETIVGINLALLNNTENDIVLQRISTKNVLYEFDYNNYLERCIDQKTKLTEIYDNYSYKAISINDERISLIIEPSKSGSLFIPLLYFSEVKYIDKLPIYIEYSLNGEIKTFTIDDFRFMSKGLFVSADGLVKYEYNYYSS
ncbi:MAG: hypothetical protein H6687_02075 [Bacillales bacterium]|nr:hypothetical protein [Bacillales bacterium]